jgi:hypothetical protein
MATMNDMMNPDIKMTEKVQDMNHGGLTNSKTKPKSPIIQQLNPKAFSNTLERIPQVLNNNHDSEHEDYYEASADLDQEPFFPLLSPGSIFRLADRTKPIQSEICHMNNRLAENIPLRLDLIDKCVISVPFACSDLTQDEITLLRILGEEMYPLDSLENEILIESKLHQLQLLNHNQSWWCWFCDWFYIFDNPRKSLENHNWVKYLTTSNLDVENSNESTHEDIAIDLDKIFYSIFYYC